ncbi:FAD-dependent thymidylate synthase [Oligella urethralis]|uniref:FAD-dependent thymidylate synthase n=1 Tax=Oligella urethralis TaxID=90245 RepID=A0A2X1UWI3_9BURK|nr:FAD-dependent thymidylate synthase [Oligella urethralis]SPY08083.1 FAD-dependent thymidylate synthase [Oligella urethralis]
MLIKAKVIEDSKHAYEGTRVTTLELTYPRFLHEQFLTHRVFSRNASSSRAIPVERMISKVEENPVIPEVWGKNKSGMQPDEPLDDKTQAKATAVWKEAMAFAVKQSREMAKLGVHKQWANRLTEPYQHIKVLVTSTEWGNFFHLRDHKDAQYEIQLLAKAIKEALNASKPKLLLHGEWHLPYVTQEERERFIEDPETLCKLSSARCARVSYNNFDGTSANVEKDLELFEKLAGSNPIHASALEHPCRSAVFSDARNYLPTNFKNFLQFRRIVERELLNNDL